MSYANPAIKAPHTNTTLTQHSIDVQVMQKLLALENQYGGRIGLSLMNTQNNSAIHYRASERFPLASTFKVMAVAAMLKESESQPQLLAKKIAYTEQEVKDSGYAPITSKHLKTGMTIEALCAAALQFSDNAAVNLLMQQLGGPDEVTAFARHIGDTQFNLTRWEPQLNLVYPGETQDTTTPNAMSLSLQKLVLGDILQKPQRDKLKNWLINNTTGDTKIRAMVPSTWIIGDKTGSGRFGATNDIAVLWPPKYNPFILSVYYVQQDIDAKNNNKIIREVTRSLLDIININEENSK
ncbi:class A beta-lactamase [uncultured Shewanella sp.]|uniref:class A beta-lactamase n=1 Tax=uncultured Shewanella sp. TaxID=173975 RepID=UPI002616192C|nr:class A beta-lactamase [uncultured Shewanella sp.]